MTLGVNWRVENVLMDYFVLWKLWPGRFRWRGQMGRKGVLNSTVSLPNIVKYVFRWINNRENWRGKGEGRNGTNGRLLLVFGSPYTCQLCLTDPVWDNSPGGLRKILSQRYFLFLFFSFSAQLQAHVSRAEKCHTQCLNSRYTANIGSHTRALYRYRVNIP